MAKRLGGQGAKIQISQQPACPSELIYLWNWFVEINSGVAGNGFGPSRITWRDIQAWSELIGERPSPFDTRTIITLSGLRAETLSEE